MVLGFSRYLFARFVPGQGLDEVVRGHLAAFAAVGGVPKEILYDRMKTAVVGEDQDGTVIFNKMLVDLACHHGFAPKACRPYRAKTTGKVERPYRYIRQDFLDGRSFRNLDDLNRQLASWLCGVANARVHGTTRRVVAEAFVEDRAALLPLPAWPFRSLLKLERRITKDGMVSVDGNLYSVPDGTQKRAVEVQIPADEIRILEAGRSPSIRCSPAAVDAPCSPATARRRAAQIPPADASCRRASRFGNDPWMSTTKSAGRWPAAPS